MPCGASSMLARRHRNDSGFTTDLSISWPADPTIRWPLDPTTRRTRTRRTPSCGTRQTNSVTAAAERPQTRWPTSPRSETTWTASVAASRRDSNGGATWWSSRCDSTGTLNRWEDWKKKKKNYLRYIEGSNSALKTLNEPEFHFQNSRPWMRLNF